MNNTKDEFKNLRSELCDLLPNLESLTSDLREGQLEAKYVIFIFQKLMDRLDRIKGKADKLTRTFDHG